MGESDRSSAGDLDAKGRARRAADADAAAQQAEHEGDPERAVALWAAAVQECRVVPASLTIQSQPTLFVPPEADLYRPLVARAGSSPAELPGLVARLRLAQLGGGCDLDALVTELSELLSDASARPAAECLWRELLSKSSRACECAARLRPGDVDVVCFGARHLVAAGRLEQARDGLEALVQARPQAVEPRRLLRSVEAELLDKAQYVRRRMASADELMGGGNYELALDEINAATRHHGEGSEALAKAAWCLAELGRTDDARKAACRSVELDPKSAEAHLALGTVLRRRGELEDAAAEFDRCAELAGPDRALRHQAREIASHVYAELGEEAYLAAEIERASRLYADALDRNADNALAVQRMARLAELSEDYAGASQLWQRLVESGQGERAWRQRACELIADGSDDALLAAAEHCATNGEVRWADDIMRRVENTQLREQHDLFQNIPAALSDLNDMCGRGWDWFVKGDHARARDIFLKARPLCPSDQRILRGIGFALAAQAETAFGQARSELVDGAKEVLQDAIAVDPTSEDADAARGKLKWLAWQK